MGYFESSYNKTEEEEQKLEVNVPVFIDSKLDLKLKYLNESVSTEIAGWLTGEIKKDGIYLNEVLIPNQEVSSGSVDINPNAGPAMLKEFGDKCKKILGHWHSHCGFGVFWSSTDEENIKQIISPRDFFVFIVTSKGEHLVRLEATKPFRISIDKLNYELYDNEFEKSKLEIDKEVEKKIKIKEVQTNSYGGYGYIGNSNLGNCNNSLKGYSRENEDSFFKEMATGINVSYLNEQLIIEGISNLECNHLTKRFAYLKPDSSYAEWGGSTIIFNIKKKKKAKVLLRQILDELTGYGSELVNQYGSKNSGGSVYGC